MHQLFFKVQRRLAALSGFLIVFIAVAAVAEVPNWSDPGCCGLNSLYCLLKVSGREVDYRQLANLVEVDKDKGSSLEDLRQVARQIGWRSEIYQMRPEDIADLPTPFLMHLELLDYGGAGHFVTVLQVDEETDDGRLFRFFDGGTSRITHQKLSSLKPMMSGYVLLAEQSPGDGWLTWPIARRLLIAFPLLAAAVVFLANRKFAWSGV